MLFESKPLNGRVSTVTGSVFFNHCHRQLMEESSVFYKSYLYCLYSNEAESFKTR